MESPTVHGGENVKSDSYFSVPSAPLRFYSFSTNRRGVENSQNIPSITDVTDLTQEEL
jgi:hypothetical protein